MLASIERHGYVAAMRHLLGGSACFAFALGMLLVACGGPPKQADVPEIVDDGSGADMAGEQAAPTPLSSAEAGAAKPNEEEMHAKCCDACKAGLAKDRTGSAPNTIPCADFTAELSPWCLEHFRGRPTMASECK
jgi:hypothetical protein